MVDEREQNMVFKDESEELIHYITDLQEEKVIGLIHKRLKSGDDPLRIVQDCQKGVYKVGALYEKKEYYLSGLIMAGEILQKTMELIRPVMEKENIQMKKGTGRIVIGTASGDIHDIGKDIIVMLLSCAGFTVYDLGVDVPPEKFLEKTIEVKPHVVGISALLTTAHESLHETIDLLKSEIKTSRISMPQVIIGGGQIDETVCDQVGSDAWTNDALEGLRYCQQVIKNNH